MSNVIKVLSFGRVGTVAINNFLNLHPDIHAEAWQIQSEKVQNKLEQAKSNTALLAFDNTHKYNTLMLHDAVFLPTEAPLVKEFVNQLKSQKILHLVRNPYEQALSWLNYINAESITARNKRYKPASDVESMMLSNPKVLESLKLGLACQTYYSDKADIKVVDFNALLPEHASSTMNEIFTWLDLANFDSPAFHNIQNSTLTNMMQEGIDFEIEEEKLNFALVLDSEFKEKYEGTDIQSFGQFKGSQLLEKFKMLTSLLDEEIHLVFSKNQREQLSPSFEQALIEDPLELLQTLVTKWGKKAQSKIKLSKRLYVETLSPQDINYLDKALSDDLEVFYQYNPEYKAIWQCSQ